MLSVKEKIAYGLGDTASNIVFQTVVLFLAFFYTDIFGLSPALVGLLFLSVKILDAITDPLMGIIADRTRTKHGQFRPYVLWLALPFGVTGILTFTAPDLPEDAKVLYAFITYGLFMLFYTAINIPYSALGAVLTANISERVSVQSYRFAFGMTGGLLVSALTIPLVNWFGGGDQALGYQLTMAAMSAAGVVMLALCFMGTKERVVATETPPYSVRADWRLLWENDQWRILCLATLILFLGMVLRNTLAIYYVKYYLEQEDLITLFLTVGMVGNICGCMACTYFAQRFCKIRLYRALLVLASVISAASVMIASEAVILAILMHFMWGFALQMATPLLWAKIADVGDYGYSITGKRMTAMVYSTIVLFSKFGLALGGAAAGLSLAIFEYESGQFMAQSTIDGILVSFTLVPAFCFLTVAIVMRSYVLDRKAMSKLTAATQEQ